MWYLPRVEYIIDSISIFTLGIGGGGGCGLGWTRLGISCRPGSDAPGLGAEYEVCATRLGMCYTL